MKSKLFQSIYFVQYGSPLYPYKGLPMSNVSFPVSLSCTGRSLTSDFADPVRWFMTKSTKLSFDLVDCMCSLISEIHS